MTTHARRFVFGALVIALVGTLAIHEGRGASDLPKHFTAVAINMGTLARTRSGVVDIVVLRWSTKAKKDRLAGALLDEGPKALFAALQEIPGLGFVRTPDNLADNLAYNLRFAWEEPAEDGSRRVILATDRPLSLWDVRLRSIDYPFTLIELRLNRDGEGDGKMSITTKITTNTKSNLIELEDYANEPMRLMLVQSRHPAAPLTLLSR